MPLRRFIDDNQRDHFTAICDRCLRIGATAASAYIALSQSGFRNESYVIPREALPETRVVCDVPCVPICTGMSRRGGGSRTYCPKCNYTLTSWSRLAEMGPYVAGEPCPSCDYQGRTPEEIAELRAAAKGFDFTAPLGSVALAKPPTEFPSIRRFQIAVGLTADGIPGEQTLRVLVGTLWRMRDAVIQIASSHEGVEGRPAITFLSSADAGESHSTTTLLDEFASVATYLNPAHLIGKECTLGQIRQDTYTRGTIVQAANDVITVEHLLFGVSSGTAPYQSNRATVAYRSLDFFRLWHLADDRTT